MHTSAFSTPNYRGIDSYAIDPADVVTTENTLPALPTETEARAWILARREGKSQAEIAAEMKRSQGSISRAISRADAKIWDLVRRQLITIDRLEAELRRGLDLNPRK